jgi:hypothetical protein
MSVRLLKNSKKVHELQDDLESHFYVVLYHAMRYLRHDKTPYVSSMMSSLFDDYTVLEDDTVIGGEKKGCFVVLEETPRWEDNPALNDFMPEAKEYIKDWMLSKVAKNKTDNTTPPLALRDHSDLLRLFEKGYTCGKWPQNDAAKDYLPKKRARDDEDEPVEVPQKSLRSSIQDSASRR